MQGLRVVQLQSRLDLLLRVREVPLVEEAYPLQAKNRSQVTVDHIRVDEAKLLQQGQRI